MSVAVGPWTVIASAGELSGVALEPTADGLLRTRIERLAVRDVTARRGDDVLQVASAVLHGVSATIARGSATEPSGAALRLGRDLAVTKAELAGVEASLALPGLGGATIDDLRLDAIADLDGVLRAFVTDALWFVDADLTVPVLDGRVRVAGIDVEHIGPNSRLGVDPRGVFAQPPHGGRIYLASFGAPGSPTPITAAGELDLAALARAVLGRSASAPTLERPDLLPAIRRTRLTGELQLGDGALGTGAQYAVFARRDDQRNRIEMSSPALGERIVFRMPQLFASSMQLAAGAHVLRAGTSTATLDVVLGPRDGDAGRRAHVAVSAATIEALRITVAASDGA